jgi:hypothetical protein
MAIRAPDRANKLATYFKKHSALLEKLVVGIRL